MGSAGARGPALATHGNCGMSAHGWIAPDWPAPSKVHALITTRAGGISRGAYAGLNLGLRSGDDAQDVERNRARLRQWLPAEPLWLRQVHGTTVVDADTVENDPEADAAFARRKGRVCAVLTADCLPLLLCDEAGTTVVAVHAGWRGLCSGVIEQTLRAMNRPPQALLAYLGPAIGVRGIRGRGRGAPGFHRGGCAIRIRICAGRARQILRRPVCPRAQASRAQRRRQNLWRRLLHLHRARALFFLSPRRRDRAHGEPDLVSIVRVET